MTLDNTQPNAGIDPPVVETLVPPAGAGSGNSVVNQSVVAPEAPVVAEIPAVSPLIAALSDSFTIPQGWTDDDLKAQIGNWFDRSSKLKDDEDIDALRRAATQYQELAPQLTAFQKWQQDQQAAASQAQQAQADADKAKWQIPELSTLEQSLITVNDKGRYVAADNTDPSAIQAATKANQRQMARQQMAERFVNDPQGFIAEATKPEMDRVRKEYEEKLAAVEQKLTPLQQQQQIAAQQNEYHSFVQQHHDLLTAPDPANAENRVWSPAAGVFQQKFKDLMDKGVPEITARDIAIEFAGMVAKQPAPLAPVVPVVPTTPAQQRVERTPDPKRAAARAIDIAKSREPNSGGAVVTPTGGARTLSQLVAQKSREYAAAHST